MDTLGRGALEALLRLAAEAGGTGLSPAVLRELPTAIPGQPQEKECQIWSEFLTVCLRCKTHNAPQAFDKTPDPELLGRQPKWREAKSKRTRGKTPAEASSCSNASSLNLHRRRCSEYTVYVYLLIIFTFNSNRFSDRSFAFRLSLLNKLTIFTLPLSDNSSIPSYTRC